MTRALVLFFAFLASTFADTINLRNGTSVTGSWIGLDSTYLMMLVDDQVHRYPRSEVAGVIFGSGDANRSTDRPTFAPIPPPPPPESQSDNVQEPEAIGEVYLKDASGRLVPLERQQATSKAIKRISRAGAYAEIKGASSSVRFKKGQKLLFVVQLANGIDPSIYGLYPLDSKKTVRVVKPDRSNLQTGLLTYRLKISKVGNSSYGLTPLEDLAEGEYAISPFGSNDSYCFGVDSVMTLKIPLP